MLKDLKTKTRKTNNDKPEMRKIFYELNGIEPRQGNSNSNRSSRELTRKKRASFVTNVTLFVAVFSSFILIGSAQSNHLIDGGFESKHFLNGTILNLSIF